MQRPEIVGHRGASHDAPENTLASVKLAWEQNADAAEIDIYLTTDEKVICFHDRELGRTAPGKKMIAECSWADDLQGLDAGSWKDPRWAGEPIPMLADVLATIPDDKRLFVEIKVGPEIVPYVVPLVAESGKRPEQIAFISFNAGSCRAIKQALPEHEVYLLSGFEKRDDGTMTPTIAELIAEAKDLGIDGIDVNYGGPLTPEAVAEVHAAGMFIAAWTVDDPAVARKLHAVGVDSITTNKPALLLETFAATESTQTAQ